MAIALLASVGVYVFPGLIIAGLGAILLALGKRRAVTSAVIAMMLFLGTPVWGEEERLDAFTAQGQRQGYATPAPREPDRVDLYTKDGKRLGYGQVNPWDGKVDVFTKDGKRLNTLSPTPRRK